jgi:hypothetical protein
MFPQKGGCVARVPKRLGPGGVGRSKTSLFTRLARHTNTQSPPGGTLGPSQTPHKKPPSSREHMFPAQCNQRLEA